MNQTILAILCVLALTTCSAALPPNHTFTVTHPNNDETTITAVEIRNATRIAAHNWIERATSPSTSLDITVTRPSTLVAYWWGSGGGGTHTATPNNGFTVIESFTLDGNIIQCTIAVKSVAAGTHNVTWTSGTGEGAQLWMVALDAPAGGGEPILGAHALAWDPIGSGGTDTTTAGVTTDPSVGAGSVILVAAAHHHISKAELPFDSEGNTYSQIGTSHTYIDWPFAGTALYATFPVRTQNRSASDFDFDGDSKTDIGIFRPSVGEWWIHRSGDGQVPAFQFGAGTDKIAAADFTGDGETDVAFFRPSTGEWYVLRSEDQSFFSFPFGANGDVPVPADYDADGKADPAVFRLSNGTWFIQRSSDNGTTISQFGSVGDVPVPADYDGDGRADLAIYRVAAGEWWLNRTTAGPIVYQFGNSTDKQVEGDYTGDGKADVAFWRPSTGEWFILRSEDTSYYSAPFGSAGDTVVPGDYDGDGKFDVSVFRPSSATWFVNRTTGGTLVQDFGTTGDSPLPSAYVP